MYCSHPRKATSFHRQAKLLSRTELLIYTIIYTVIYTVVYIKKNVTLYGQMGLAKSPSQSVNKGVI